MRDGIYKKKLDDLIVICRKNLRVVNEDLIKKAFDFSLEAHKKDSRVSGEPFFTHPYEVARIVAKEIPLDDISVASALLHDVAEDTDYEIKDIRAEFGDTIADIVDGATKISDIFRGREVTQVENYRKMLISMVNDIRVMLLKFADRLHNMRTLEYLNPDKQERLARETLDIYAPFAHRFGLAKIRWELEDLSFKYLHPKEYEEIARKLKAKRREREAYIKKFVSPIEKALTAAGMKFEIEGRPKNLYSIYNKMITRSKPFEEIYDLFAVRIILDTDNPNDCFTAFGILTSIYFPISERFKNYISIPKKNLYRSLHSTVIGPEGKMVEIQIRTQEMHEVAEKGVAAHWKYKEKITALDQELENWVNWVREIFEHADEDQPVKQLMESFKLTLYQEEIYVFTPKGDLKILPQGATPIDFAFDVHSKVGFHCLSAKVNGRIVPLDYKLHSGDQVEIITSKKQTPNADWEQFVVTHKAKTHIRKWIKESERLEVEKGKEQWEKRLKKFDVHISDNELVKYLPLFMVSNKRQLFIKIQRGELSPDIIIQEIINKTKHSQKDLIKEHHGTGIIDRIFKTARRITGGIKLLDSPDTFLHSYAKCCNPIPGDEILGFITQGDGVKVHRKSCKNMLHLSQSDPQRLVQIGWPSNDNSSEFMVAITVSGEDRAGILGDITHSISSYQNTKIRSLKIDTKDSAFTGIFMIYVKNTDHMNRILERLRKINGVTFTERFYG